MLRHYSVNIARKAANRNSALGQQQKASGIILFGDLNVEHAQIKIGALEFTVKLAKNTFEDLVGKGWNLRHQINCEHTGRV
jgi:hypothetical protein